MARVNADTTTTPLNNTNTTLRVSKDIFEANGAHISLVERAG
jgi:hypothetical protein